MCSMMLPVRTGRRKKLNHQIWSFLIYFNSRLWLCFPLWFSHFNSLSSEMEEPELIIFLCCKGLVLKVGQYLPFKYSKTKQNRSIIHAGKNPYKAN